VIKRLTARPTPKVAGVGIHWHAWNDPHCRREREGLAHVQSRTMQSGAADALAVVHEYILVCTDCPLHLKRIQAVPGSGPAGARIMAVGEGPGETEDRVGRPFVGAAGNVLTKLLESIGLRRDDIYITNVVKCRPPGNRDPEPAEMEACSHFLDAQIEIIRPDVILILGRHALARLLPGAGGISGLHGRKVVRGDRLYVPLYHPAAALYQGSLMRTLEDDMLKVRGYLDEAEARRRQPVQAAPPVAHAQAGATTSHSPAPPSASPAHAEPLLSLVAPEPGEPVLRLGSPGATEPPTPPEPPSRDQLSLF
jgi:DNA polymerase